MCPPRLSQLYSTLAVVSLAYCLSVCILSPLLDVLQGQQPAAAQQAAGLAGARDIQTVAAEMRNTLRRSIVSNQDLQSEVKTPADQAALPDKVNRFAIGTDGSSLCICIFDSPTTANQ